MYRASMLQTMCHRSLLSLRCLQAYCNHHQQLTYSTVKQNVSFVKQWNSQNKRMFGPLLKKPPKKKSVKKSQKTKGTSDPKPIKDKTPAMTFGSIDEQNKPVLSAVDSIVLEPTYQVIGGHKGEISQDMIDSLGNFDVGIADDELTLEHWPDGQKESLQGSPGPETIENVKIQQNMSNVSKTSDSGSRHHSLDSLLIFPMLQNSNPVSFPQISRGSGGSVVPPEVEQLSYYDAYPSVTKILEKTRPPEAQFYLDRWKKQMIEELGVEGFQLWQKETFAKGANLHRCIHSHLEGKPGVEADLTEVNQGHWASLQPVLPDVSEVRLLEERVRHPHLHYRGIFDCIANYRGELCLIDWKTSKKPKPTLRDTYDNPLQLAAYVGAVNYDERHDLQIGNAMVVVTYEDGSAAHAHWLSREKCVEYWGQWLHRLHQYWKQYLREMSERET